MSKRAILYARVSGDDRKKEGRNLAGQLEMYREYCAEKDYRIVAELAEDDRGASGASWDLPMLNKALDMAREGAFDVLVTRELDRFARSLAKQLVIESEFKRHGVEIEYTLAQYDDSPEGKLNKHIRAVIAEFEREKINQRMTRGRRNVVKGGRVLLHGNHAPYGYRFEEERDDQGNIKAKCLVVDSEEAEVIERIFTLYAYGNGETISSVADKLTTDKIPTWSDKHDSPFERKAGPGEWAKSTVYKILSNETYAGTWHYGKRGRHRDNPKSAWVELEGGCPAIVDEETFNIVQGRLAENKRKSKRRTKRNYLLRGRVICGHCNTRMIGRAEKMGRYMYYYCPKGIGKHINETCSNNRYFKVKSVDGGAWDYVKEILYTPEAYRTRLEAEKEFLTKENNPATHRIEAVDGLLRKKRKRRERLLNLYLDGGIEQDDYMELKESLDVTIKSLEDERANLESQLVCNPETIERLDYLIEHAELASSMMREMGPDPDFETKHQWVEALNIRAVLTQEDGKKFALVEISLSPFESTNIHASGQTVGITIWDLLILAPKRSERKPTTFSELLGGGQMEVATCDHSQVKKQNLTSKSNYVIISYSRRYLKVWYNHGKEGLDASKSRSAT